MHKCLRLLWLFLALLLVAGATITPLQATPAPALSVSAAGACLIDAEHGLVLYEKNADTRLPMASTTKIMTAMVAMRHMPLDTVITVDTCAVGVEGSSIYLTEGEQLTLEELLYALLLESANDAAAAIAIAVGGSVAGFAALMNREAESLGLQNTHFENPHGLHHEAHYTTARELAVITAEAMKSKDFCRIVSTVKHTISHGGTADVRLLINHNKLLRSYEGAIGVKTGYTKRSGRCLVSAAEREGVRLIAVTLNAPDDWQDHTAMLDYGFSHMKSLTLCATGEVLLQIPVVNGTEGAITVSNRQGLTVAVPLNAPEIGVTVEAPRFLYAPLQAGECIGRVVYQADLNRDGVREVIGEAPLTTQTEVIQKSKKKGFWSWLIGLFGF